MTYQKILIIDTASEVEHELIEEVELDHSKNTYDEHENQIILNSEKDTNSGDLDKPENHDESNKTCCNNDNYAGNYQNEEQNEANYEDLSYCKKVFDNFESLEHAKDVFYKFEIEYFIQLFSRKTHWLFNHKDC